jgi:hypothetical protein
MDARLPRGRLLFSAAAYVRPGAVGARARTLQPWIAIARREGRGSLKSRQRLWAAADGSETRADLACAKGVPIEDDVQHADQEAAVLNEIEPGSASRIHPRYQNRMENLRC